MAPQNPVCHVSTPIGLISDPERGLILETLNRSSRVAGAHLHITRCSGHHDDASCAWFPTFTARCVPMAVVTMMMMRACTLCRTLSDPFLVTHLPLELSQKYPGSELFLTPGIPVGNMSLETNQERTGCGVRGTHMTRCLRIYSVHLVASLKIKKASEFCLSLAKRCS